MRSVCQFRCHCWTSPTKLSSNSVPDDHQPRGSKSMKTLFFGLAALPLLAGVAMAGQPASLTDAQMDKVTAGLSIVIVNGDGFVIHGGTVACPFGCTLLEFPTID